MNFSTVCTVSDQDFRQKQNMTEACLNSLPRYLAVFYPLKNKTNKLRQKRLSKCLDLLHTGYEPVHQVNLNVWMRLSTD